MLTLEIYVASLRVAHQNQLSLDEYQQTMLMELYFFLDENMQMALGKIEKSKQKMVIPYNKEYYLT